MRVFLAQPDFLAHRPPGEEVLSPDDLAHVARFRFDADQAIARASRTLQRLALSECAPIEPSRWGFAADTAGKPFIIEPADAPPLRFSVANTRGLVACAIAWAVPVGVDVELVRSDTPWDVVERCWSAVELDALNRLAPADQPRRFTESWVAKEAYAKATGQGLSLDLQHVRILFDDSHARLELDASLHDEAEAWQLGVWWPGPAHAAALCVRTGGQPLPVSHHWLGRPFPTSPGVS